MYKRYEPINEGKSPFAPASSQSDMNKNFQKGIAKYIPFLGKVSYEDFSTKYRDITNLVLKYKNNKIKSSSGKVYSSLDYYLGFVDGTNPEYKGAKIKTIEKKRKNSVILDSGSIIEITPKEITQIIEFKMANK